MTITPEAPTSTHDIQVRTDPAGKPHAVRHDGRIWIVDPATEYQHWFTRDAWWDTRRTAPVGIGNLVDIEYWRVQVSLGSNSALRTFTLRRELLATEWLLESITDN